MKYVIAIDGPAGAGKSTVAKLLAQRLGFLYLDTGALYRTLTLKALEQKVDLTKEELLVKIVKSTRIELKNTPEGLRIFMDGKEVTEEVRIPEVTNNTFYVARSPKVRASLLPLQRNFAIESDLVTEGRDTTTVVFPDATLKIYLDADLKTRGVRREKDLIKAKIKQSLEKITAEVAERDNYDRSRSVAPLRQASDAVYVDTTNLTITEVVDRLASLFHAIVSADDRAAFPAGASSGVPPSV